MLCFCATEPEPPLPEMTYCADEGQGSGYRCECAGTVYLARKCGKLRKLEGSYLLIGKARK
jgi:hypothetical protein